MLKVLVFFSDRKAQNLSIFIFSVVSNIVVLFFREAENLSNFILSNIIDLSNIIEWSVIEFEPREF